MESKTLKDIMPIEFLQGEYNSTRAYKMKDIPVIKEHCHKWPGKHKNVHIWVELENGYAIGWVENPMRGWSFPVHKL